MGAGRNFNSIKVILLSAPWCEKRAKVAFVGNQAKDELQVDPEQEQMF